MCKERMHHQPRAFIASSMAAPICRAGAAQQRAAGGKARSTARTFAGDATTLTPAARSAAILSLALPLPPEMMAPACPMRRPGGAVRPAMNETTGLVVFEACSARERLRPGSVDNKQRTSRLDELGSLLFGSATDFADHDDALRLRVSDEALQAVHKVGAVERVAADADTRGLAEAHGSRLENLLSQPQEVSHAARKRRRLAGHVQLHTSACQSATRRRCVQACGCSPA